MNSTCGNHRGVLFGKINGLGIYIELKVEGSSKLQTTRLVFSAFAKM